MNEHLFASKIRNALDESAEHLPYRVTQRLERARQAALARAPQIEASPVVPMGSMTLGLQPDDRPSGLYRLLSALAPIMLVLAGFYAIALWDDAQRVAETADIDAAIVLGDDEIPIEGYADRGFGVFIKNSRQ
jgi:hypothetical protein